MGSKLRAGMVAALLLLVGSVTVASATSSVDSGFRSDERKGSSGSDGHKTVILHLRAEANRPTTYVDLGEPELSEGDQFVFANDLFSGDMKVGEDGGVCTATRVEDDEASTLYCVGGNSLPGGQIDTAGLVSYAAGETSRRSHTSSRSPAARASTEPPTVRSGSRSSNRPSCWTSHSESSF